MIPPKVQKKIDAQVLDSTEWLGTHVGPKYTSAANCEKCFLGGMAFVLAALNGTTQEQEYQAMTAKVPQPTKKRVVKKPVTKKKVGRRVKK